MIHRVVGTLVCYWKPENTEAAHYCLHLVVLNTECFVDKTGLIVFLIMTMETVLKQASDTNPVL